MNDKLTTVHFVRHGEVDNPSGQLYGRQPGFHLTPLGRAMAERAADFFDGRDLRLIVSSPLERARETAEPTAQRHGLSVVLDEGLIEAGNKFEGVNVNATLLFSPERYRQTLEAYIDGLKERVASGQSIDLLRSVASFFVSRVDSKIDALLADEHADLRGRAAIANAQAAYSYYLERISHDDWLDLAKKGAAVQRLLWASTGTKNPAYSDVRYVELLIGRDTVNTIPPATYAAYKDHGRAEETLLRNIDQAPQLLQQISEAGIDWAQLYVELEAEGLAGFEKAFSELLATLTGKIKTLRQAAEQSAAPAAETAMHEGDSVEEAVEEHTAAAPETEEMPEANTPVEPAVDDVATPATTEATEVAPSVNDEAAVDDDSDTTAVETDQAAGTLPPKESEATQDGENTEGNDEH